MGFLPLLPVVYSLHPGLLHVTFFGFLMIVTRQIILAFFLGFTNQQVLK